MTVFTLTNGRGVALRVLSYGGIIQSLMVPDRTGRLRNVVLGFESPEHYYDNPKYIGALIGRYANRIAGARFSIDGQFYALTANDGANHLHGGRQGFDKVEWHAEAFESGDAKGVALQHTSPDGHEGYPGNLTVRVLYLLTSENELILDYHATTDRATHISCTHHNYFNLSGEPDTTIHDHMLRINADRYAPVDAALIPTGELRSVSGTAFDFSEPCAIGARIDSADEQLRFGHGYDHSFLLNRGAGSELVLAAEVHEPVSGRVLEIHTTEPALQFYSGSFLERARTGFALETQHLPDSPNQPAFPSTLLSAGEAYHSRTVYRFSTRS